MILQAAKLLGPSEPSPHLNLALLGIVVNTAVEDGPNKVFVGGLPTNLTEDQVGAWSSGVCRDVDRVISGFFPLCPSRHVTHAPAC